MTEQKLYTHCLRCGRRLKTDDARLRGMGNTCWEKAQKSPKIKLLFEVKNAESNPRIHK